MDVITKVEDLPQDELATLLIIMVEGYDTYGGGFDLDEALAEDREVFAVEAPAPLVFSQLESLEYEEAQGTVDILEEDGFIERIQTQEGWEGYIVSEKHFPAVWEIFVSEVQNPNISKDYPGILESMDFFGGRTNA